MQREHPGGDEHEPPVGAPPAAAPQAGIRAIVLVRWGILAWILVLVVLLVTPSLRHGERSWWVWVPVAGILLGALGHIYLRTLSERTPPGPT